MTKSLLVFLFALLVFTAHAVLVFEQPLNPTGSIHQSSFVVGDTDADRYTWENFTLPTTEKISEVRWYGGYIYNATYGKATKFTIRFWATNPLVYTEPDVINPALKSYSIVGNAGEAPTAYTGIYEYHYTLPTVFTAQAGVQYWIQIEGIQPYPDWGLGDSSTGDGSHFAYVVGLHQYNSYPGNLSFSLYSLDSGNVTVNASASPPEGGTITGTGTYPIGSTVTLKATPSTGYGFVNWRENGILLGNSATYSFTASANRDIVAKFAPKISGLTVKPMKFCGGKPATGTVTLAVPAPDGCTVALSNSSYGLVTTPSSVAFAVGATQATFDILSYPTDSDLPVPLTAKSGKLSKTVTFTLLAPVLKSFSLLPKAVTGGGTLNGTITLTGQAGFYGYAVSMSATDPAVVMPTSTYVFIDKLLDTATFTLATLPVGTDTLVTVTGTHGTSTISATVTVKAPVVKSLGLKPATLVGGKTSVGTVTLNGIAAAGGVVVSLASSDPNLATVPASVTVPEGSNFAKFTIATTAVSASATATISATTGAVTRTKLLTVTP